MIRAIPTDTFLLFSKKQLQSDPGQRDILTLIQPIENGAASIRCCTAWWLSRTVATSLWRRRQPDRFSLARPATVYLPTPSLRLLLLKKMGRNGFPLRPRHWLPVAARVDSARNDPRLVVRLRPSYVRRKIANRKAASSAILTDSAASRAKACRYAARSDPPSTRPIPAARSAPARGHAG